MISINKPIRRGDEKGGRKASTDERKKRKLPLCKSEKGTLLLTGKTRNMAGLQCH
jgi:hypothetical protein